MLCQPVAIVSFASDIHLQALAAVAADDAGRLAVQEAGGVPLLIKLMDDGSPDAVRILYSLMI